MPQQLVTTPRQAADKECGCGSGCACTGLECLCRPRYFAGQLLSDEDLRRLDNYIVGKDRLHNRYLHGVGVVCGLEVVCSPCDDTITVRSGYAIGPCGEDIVVCRDTSVDVGELVRACRQRTTAGDDCHPYGGAPAQDCEASRQRWILGVCYDERPSRGVTSLHSSGRAGCGCSGDQASCGCAGSRRPQPVQCEPTVICEGYRFTLVKEPTRRETDDRPGLADSALGRRLQACLLEIASRIPKLPADPPVPELVQLCCDLKVDLRDIIETGSVHDCMLGARLSDIVCPDVEDENAAAKARQAILALLQIAIELYRSCACSALLPPCDVGSPQDCVPLATLTVRTADLRVLEVCNWDARQFAVTFPALGHWLGWLPIFDTLRDAVVRLCCAPSRTPRFRLEDDLRVRVAEPSEARRDEAGTPFSDLLTRYAAGANPLSGLEATLLTAMGARSAGDEPLAEDLELQHPLEALALTRLAGPGLAPVVPEPVTRALGQLLGGEDRMTRLEADLEELRRTVRSQARTITNLRKRVDEQ